MNASFKYVEKMLDASVLRHKLLANNLANATTPGYTRRDVEFRNQLSEALATKDMAKIDEVKLKVYEDTSVPSRPDGNNVTAQHELGEMTENSLLYQLLVRSISGKFAGIRKAIRGQ